MFQALFIDDIAIKKNGSSMTSLKYAQQVVEHGQSARWGQVVELYEKKEQS